MDRELLAEGGAVAGHRVRLKLALALFGLALGVVALIAFQRPASAQITLSSFSALVCPILNALAAAFGGIFRTTISGIAALFGCTGISGG